MATKHFLSKILSLFKFLPERQVVNSSSPQFKYKTLHATHSKFHKLTSLLQYSLEELSNTTVVFHLEGALLKSSSLFPYFMLVAFEAGGLFRAFILFLLYPLVWLLGEEHGLKVMVFVSFVGIRRKSFMIGRSVLPKFLLEDVGDEGFNAVMSAGRRKIAVSEMPRIMVECFLKDYVGVDLVVGREMKVVCGYFVGLMQGKKENRVALYELLGCEKMSSHVIIGVGCFNKTFDHRIFSFCKDIYWVTKAEKTIWKILPREKYPKPLIFHDGRLAFRPTPVASLVMFMWFPLGIFVMFIRFTSGLLLPVNISATVNASTGFRTTISRTKTSPTSTKPSGVLYVCNHRTLFDPIFVSVGVMKPLTAVTYSLSRFSEVVSPIKTIRLTRDREKDKKVMNKLLSLGDLVVCPEGTTCREPYLLRFSPLFAELTDEIVPTAVDLHVSMFYGSTASGRKWLDPLVNLFNPFVLYSLMILEKLPSSQTCNAGGKSKIEVANHVQNVIAKALGFKCTTLTRKEKYMILAGNEGII